MAYAPVALPTFPGLGSGFHRNDESGLMGVKKY